MLGFERVGTFALFVAVACGPQVDDPNASGSQSGSSGGTGDLTQTSGDASSSDTTDPPPPSRCALEPDPGFCDAAFTHWFFDPQTQRCASFIYGGCEGVVPFETRDECMTQCEPCDVYTDPNPPASQPIDVVVRNTTGQRVFVMGYEEAIDATGFRQSPVKVVDGATQGSLITAPNACDARCPDVLAAGCGYGCSDGGPPPGAIVIEAGGEFRSTLAGTFLQPVTVPTQCSEAACPDAPGVACGRWLEFSPVDYQVFVDYTLTPPCTDPLDCECTANADGWCQIGAGFDPVSYSERADGYLFYPSTEGVIEL